MSQWYTVLPEITNTSIMKKIKRAEIQESAKRISDEKQKQEETNNKLREIKRARKFVTIVIRKLSSPDSLISLYVKSRAKAGATSAYVRPYRVMSLFTYNKYWKPASKNIDLVNSLFAQDPIYKNLRVYLSAYGTDLIVSWQ